MNRTFQSKVGWWYWIVIGITSVLLFFFFWEHYLLCTILCATVVIFEIEMLIHTQYVITEAGWLKVETGRFIPNASDSSYTESPFDGFLATCFVVRAARSRF